MQTVRKMLVRLTVSNSGSEITERMVTNAVMVGLNSHNTFTLKWLTTGRTDFLIK